jgi:hypothetical protein
MNQVLLHLICIFTAIAQDKGKLFEGLVAELVNANGYRIKEMRAKTAGKEYDVVAEGTLDQKLLIGQATSLESDCKRKDASEQRLALASFSLLNALAVIVARCPSQRGHRRPPRCS